MGEGTSRPTKVHFRAIGVRLEWIKWGDIKTPFNVFFAIVISRTTTNIINFPVSSGRVRESANLKNVKNWRFIASEPQEGK